MENLTNLTAVITGAGRGLGAALAITLADAGCSTILCGRSQKPLDEVANAIAQRTGKRPLTVITDLADAASVRKAVTEINAQVEQIDLLVNNGAMWLEASDQPHTDEDVLGTINAAVSGTFLMTQGLLPALKRSARPDIVTIGSISGLPNAPLHSVSVPFYAAKQAQAALASGFQQLLRGTKMRSLCVNPPYLDDISPLDSEWHSSEERAKGERATNRDICEAVIFALSRPRHITLNITVDTDEGGLFG